MIMRARPGVSVILGLVLTSCGGNGEDTLVDDGGNVFLDGPPTIKSF